MTVRTPLILLAVAATLAACGNPEASKTGTEAAAAPAESTVEPASATGAFDLSSVPVSTAALAPAPYFSAPTGYRVEDSGVIPATAFPIWTGAAFQTVEGDVNWQRFGPESGKTFSRLEMSRAIAEQVQAAGGVEVAAAEVPDSAIAALPEAMRQELLPALGDHTNSPTATYVIRRADKTIWVHAVVSIEVAYLSTVDAPPVPVS